MTPSMAQMEAEFSAVIARSIPGRATANELCHACVNLLGVDGAAISMVLQGTSQGTYGSSGEASRRLDEYQFTFGQGPCLDAAARRAVVHAPDLDAVHEQRWPVFTDAVLGDGIRAVFALPVRVTSVCVGALDLYRHRPGPLREEELAGGLLAAKLAALPLLTLVNQIPEDRDSDPGVSADCWEEAQSEVLFEMDRVEVYQATGMLIAQLDVGPAEALLRLRAHAIATGQTASEVAWAIVDRRLVLDRDVRDVRGHDDDGAEGWRP